MRKKIYFLILKLLGVDAEPLNVNVKRPILMPFSKDRFELAVDYEIDFLKQFYLERAGGLGAGIGGRFRNSSPPVPCVEKLTRSRFIIPAGYKTNGANIPRIFWSVFAPNKPEYLAAALIHDYLCDNAKSANDYHFADECLKIAMLALGSNALKVACFYYSCRLYHVLKYGSKR